MLDRIKMCAIAAAVATSLTGEVFGQTTGSPPGIASPAPPGAPALSSGAGTGEPGIASPAPPGTQPLNRSATQQPADSGRARSDPTLPSTRSPASTQPSSAPASTQPSSSRGLGAGAQTQGTAAPTGTTGSTVTGGGISGGVPAMGGVTPSRAELPGSAFTKLDAGNRGYITLDDVRQLEGFESAFRQADQNGDGRLNASEFNSAWAIYTGNVR
jgi:hypothetical protein